MDAPEKESVHASCCIRMEEIAKSVIVRADDFQHPIENLFHLPHQCELGAGAVEVVIRASNMEIVVALQIVGQKTDAAFQRHDRCRSKWTLLWSGSSSAQSLAPVRMESPKS